MNSLYFKNFLATAGLVIVSFLLLGISFILLGRSAIIDEKHEDMCYVKIDLSEGFFHKAGKGYRVNFTHKTVEEFDFIRD